MFPAFSRASRSVRQARGCSSTGRIDGHSPLLSGLDLNGYLSAGVRTDHEATTLDEAREKLSKGMFVLIREGSVCKDLHALAPLVNERYSPFIAFCTDDRNPLDIFEEGHLDFVIRTAIKLGAPPIAAYRAASISAARIFGLLDRGLVAPGWRADLNLIDDLEFLCGQRGDRGRPHRRRRAVCFALRRQRRSGRERERTRA